MLNWTTLAASTAMLATVAAALPAGASSHATQMPGHGAHGGPNAAAMVKEMTEMNARMTQHLRASGDADRDFATMMIPHHQGAIDMAKALLARGTDPEMRRMAEQIIKDQEREIGEFEAWLEKRR